MIVKLSNTCLYKGEDEIFFISLGRVLAFQVMKGSRFIQQEGTLSEEITYIRKCKNNYPRIGCTPFIKYLHNGREIGKIDSP